MELFKYSTNLTQIKDLVGLKKYTWGISITLCVIAIISLFINGLNLSLEFTGGTQIEVRFQNPVSVEYISTRINNAHSSLPKLQRVQNYGSSKDFLIRLAGDLSKEKEEIKLDPSSTASTQDPKIVKQLIKVLNSDDNVVELRKIEYIGSEVGEKLVEEGAIAVLIAIFATMVYIAVRFEYKLAASAAITLCHNSVIVLGCFSVTKCEFDLATLAAVLAVIGYSLNDTIVIFDRVRENFRKYHKDPIKEIVNIAINQTLSRTIMTSFLTLLVVVSLLLVGGKSLFGFALALTIGILIGTYASICIAGTIAVWLGLSRQDFLKK